MPSGDVQSCAFMSPGPRCAGMALPQRSREPEVVEIRSCRGSGRAARTVSGPGQCEWPQQLADSASRGASHPALALQTGTRESAEHGTHDPLETIAVSSRGSGTSGAPFTDDRSGLLPQRARGWRNPAGRPARCRADRPAPSRASRSIELWRLRSDHQAVGSSRTSSGRPCGS